MFYVNDINGEDNNHHNKLTSNEIIMALNDVLDQRGCKYNVHACTSTFTL